MRDGLQGTREGYSEDITLTRELLTFLKASPTAFHAVAEVTDRLIRAGYRELREETGWELAAGGKYFVVRGGSSIIAFRLPEGEPASFMIAASHSDSPAFKLKANPEIEALGAYTKLNVERYGGMLMAPWFDRPLSVAGRLIVREENRFRTVLVNADRDLCLIPSLAIHMNREANTGATYHPQTDLLPVVGDASAKGKLRGILAEAAEVRAEDIIGEDLFLYPRSEGTIWGVSDEYVSAGHLDDLQCAFGCLTGFLRSGEMPSAEGVIPVCAVFDNEEVGSGTRQGADSTFLDDVLTRIAESSGGDAALCRRWLAESFLVSADNAHAVHPNHPEKADPVNRPVMNRGIVIKYSANQKYTTDGLSQAIFREICTGSEVPVQDFTNHSDVAGGSTLGNISTSHVSVQSVDIGLPQLAMHSPYETAGVQDTGYLVRAMERYFGCRLQREADGGFRLLAGKGEKV